jgi:hypothetical protein
VLSDGFGARLMLARSRATPSTQATLVLNDVMAKLVQEDVVKHESSQRVVRPQDCAIVRDGCACPLKTLSLALREVRAKAPRGWRLIIENDITRRDETAERQPATSSGRR